MNLFMKFSLTRNLLCAALALVVFACDNPPAENDPEVHIIHEEVRETNPSPNDVQEEEGDNLEFNVSTDENGNVNTEVKGKVDLE